MSRRASFSLLLTLLLTAPIVGCGRQSSSSGVSVVATTTQIADLAATIAGPDAAVRGLLAANTDAHDYEPTPGDAGAVADADLVLINGIGLDGWIDQVSESAGGDARTVVVTDGISRRRGDEESPNGDPHVWMDPRNAITMVATIRDAFVATDPDNADGYAARAEALTGRLRALDRELAARIATVPSAKRKIVTDHDAFGYLTDRYGIRVVGTVIPSLSTDAEPGAAELAKLAATVRREGVRVVFAEAGSDPALAGALAAEAGAILGEELYADSLGPAGSPGATYIGMMRHNMGALVTGMTGG